MSLLSGLFGKGGKRRVAHDISADARALVNDFIADNLERERSYDPLNYSGAGEKLLALPEAERLELVLYLMADAPDVQVQRAKNGNDDELGTLQLVYRELPARLLRRKADPPVETLLAMLDIVRVHARGNPYALPVAGILRMAERVAETGPLDPRLRKTFRKLESLSRTWRYAELRKLRDRIRRLAKDDVAPVFDGRQSWVGNIEALTSELDAPVAANWKRILVHASTTNSSRPTKTWLKKARQHLDELGEDRFSDLACRCIDFILDVNYRDRPLASDVNNDTVRGLVWIASMVDDKVLLTHLHELGAYAFRKVPGYGAGSSKVGNAVIYALGAQPGIAAISWLTALKGKVKYRQAQNLIGKALTAAAEARGVTIDTLEELAVPTFGIDQSGRLEVPFGEHRAVVTIGPGGKTDTTWLRPDGKEQKTVPKAVKENFGDELKALRSTARDIAKAWVAQRDRVERQFLHPVRWPVRDWRERYLMHPLMQHIARKLVFVVSEGGSETLTCWFDGALRDVDGNVLEFADSAEITLWHPIGYDADIVLAWRRFLEAREITQPVKQAHREVYIVTDAERETDVYSNRFAGHILRQHQLAALCRDRGWDYALQGAFDSHNCPTKRFAAENLIVEYYCEALGDENPITEMGIYAYVSTDQVRFTRTDYDPIRVADVPPRLFSEIMRDVDLFVGVCSIGNDPNWADGGDRPGYGEYWRSYAFGELSASAKIRREVLERIVPKLRIADRLSLDGRYLVVRGDIRTYRIHVGSGNVQMEPNNQYLCIVQGNEARKGALRILLPFEGDGMLSVILSKATLLAADKKIRDRTIVSQIRAGGLPL